jgi:hypothetical protein
MYRQRVVALAGILFLCACTSDIVAQDTVTVHAHTDTIRSAMDTSAAAADSSGADTVTAREPPWYNNRNGPLDDSLIPRRLPAGVVSNFRQQDDFWYVPVGPHPHSVAPKPSSTLLRRLLLALGRLLSKPWFVFLLWTFAAGAVLASIVLILQATGGGRWAGRPRKAKTLQQDDPDSRHEVPDLLHFLQLALDRSDYTAAVRYLFLITLARMAERRLIVTGPGLTNRDYTRQLSGHPLHAEFSRLVLRYEYTFYGGFVPSVSSFPAIREQYEQFQHRLDVL